MYKVSIPMDVCVFLQYSVRFRDREKAYHVVTVYTLSQVQVSSLCAVRIRFEATNIISKSHEDSRNS